MPPKVAKNPSLIYSCRNNGLFEGDMCAQKLGNWCSGRYFRSNMETIRTEESRVNRDVANGDFVTLNTLYNALGLDGIRFGDDFGWGNSYSVRDPQALDIDITYEVRVLNGKEVAVGILDYKVCVDRDSFGSYFHNWVR